MHRTIYVCFRLRVQRQNIITKWSGLMCSFTTFFVFVNRVVALRQLVDQILPGCSWNGFSAISHDYSLIANFCNFTFSMTSCAVIVTLLEMTKIYAEALTYHKFRIKPNITCKKVRHLRKSLSGDRNVVFLSNRECFLGKTNFSYLLVWFIYWVQIKHIFKLYYMHLLSNLLCRSM